MHNNLEADWGEVVVYKQIPFTYQNISHPFSYSFRSSRASYYLNAELPNLLLKRLNFDKPEFKKHWQDIGTLLKQNVRWASLKGVDFDSEWSPALLYENVKIKRIKEIEDINERVDYLNQCKIQLLKLYDYGYYFKGFDEYNISVANDKLKIIGWDSICPVEVNKTFKDYYPWVWVL